MKGRRWVVVTAVAVALSASAAAQAALYDRGGGLIYDSVLNVTWLQNANYAKTSGYDLEGLMTWAEATAWVGGLSYYDSVRGQTLTGWRLPTVSPVNGTSFNYNLSDDGSTDAGYNISAPGTAYAGATGSELAYMFYNNLIGSEPKKNPDGTENPDWEINVVSQAFFDAASGQTKAFENLQPSYYWSGTAYTPPAPISDYAWYFNPGGGGQAGDHKSTHSFAWAVRPGDVAAVPLPAGLWLFSSALALLGVARKQE